jgi:hypothetical protein
MPIHSYKVYFSRTSTGEAGDPITTKLKEAVAQHGAHLPQIELDGEYFQMRNMNRIGAVWTGTFVKLREDVPNVVAANDQEHELELQEGDRIIEKCHFIFREKRNVIIWQINRMAGSLTKAANYLSNVFNAVTILPQIMNDAELDRVMSGQLYEIDFAYDRPASLADSPPVWSQNEFNMMSKVGAAHAKFTLRAPRRGHLLDSIAKAFVRKLMSENGTKKIRIRLTDESDPIELFMAPLKDNIQIDFIGRYPPSNDVYKELEIAFGRQKESIPE